MDIICIDGATPGPVRVTLSHQGRLRHLVLDLARHEAGGWKARRPGLGGWSLRCSSVTTAILFEASEALAEEEENGPRAAFEMAAD